MMTFPGGDIAIPRLTNIRTNTIDQHNLRVVRTYLALPVLSLPVISCDSLQL